MAEPEEIDEDLFADLYDNEEPAPQVDDSINQPAVIEPSPPTQAGNALDTEMTTGENYADDVRPEANHQQASEVDNTFDQNDSGWHGNDLAADNERSSGTAAPEHTGIAIKEDGKMFIGGLNWETTDESLRRHFEEFGEVVECTVMRDAATGRSRGFGFLTFKDPKTVNTVMVKEHFLDGKIIDPKRAIPRDEQERTSKIFVGGVSQEATEEDFKGYFTQYGRVIDATLMIDKDTKRPRGFGFVTFDSEAAVEATLKGDLTILGKPIEVKRAQPRGSVKEEENSLQRGRGRGGRGDMQNEGGGMGQGGGMGYANGMTPQMMAQYFQRMQQYFANMMAGMGGGMMGGMNPAMMQQMQQMQRMQQQGGMTPQMMQQMQQQMQQQQQQQPQQQSSQQQQTQQAPQGPAGANGPVGAPSGPASMNNQGGGRRNQQGNMGYQGGPTSWEGMYDDVPQPDMGGGGNGGGGMGGGRRDHGHGYGRGGRHPPKQPSAAPANAPTGPRNAGVPGANYRGGGRGNHHRGGYHPYGRR